MMENNPFQVVRTNIGLAISEKSPGAIDRLLEEGVSPLDISIAKWETIESAYANGIDEFIFDMGINTCALCQTSRANCDGCAVYSKTGKNNCRSTPYEMYVKQQYAQDKDSCQRLAREEKEFLIGLKSKEFQMKVTWTNVVVARDFEDAAEQISGMFQYPENEATYLRIENLETGDEVFRDFEGVMYPGRRHGPTGI